MLRNEIVHCIQPIWFQFSSTILAFSGVGDGTNSTDGVDFLNMRLRLREGVKEKLILIFVISVIVFVAGTSGDITALGDGLLRSGWSEEK